MQKSIDHAIAMAKKLKGPTKGFPGNPEAVHMDRGIPSHYAPEEQLWNNILEIARNTGGYYTSTNIKDKPELDKLVRSGKLVAVAQTSPEGKAVIAKYKLPSFYNKLIYRLPEYQPADREFMPSGLDKIGKALKATDMAFEALIEVLGYDND